MKTNTTGESIALLAMLLLTIGIIILVHLLFIIFLVPIGSLWIIIPLGFLILMADLFAFGLFMTMKGDRK